MVYLKSIKKSQDGSTKEEEYKTDETEEEDEEEEFEEDIDSD